MTEWDSRPPTGLVLNEVKDRIFLRGLALFTVEPSANVRRRLTSGATERDFDPTWSPNGREIAFTRDPFSGSWAVWVVDVNGLSERRLTQEREGSDEGQPAWSPDGRHVAFARYDHELENQDLYVVAADGSGERRLTSHPGVDGQPDWSPDGRSIVFVRDDNRELSLYVMDRDGGGERRLTTDGFTTRPAWAPDGRSIAYEQSFGIWSIAVNGTGAEKIIGQVEGWYPFEPTWSPDGRELAFHGVAPGNRIDHDLLAIRPDKADLRRVTDQAGYVGDPDWQPPAGATGAVAVAGAGTTSCARLQRGTRGDDILTGTPETDRLEGGPGDDLLRGRGGDDCLDGGSGRDRISGGEGRDRISGGSGADRIFVADGERDVVACGSGRDSVSADRRDRVRGCERVRRRR